MTSVAHWAADGPDLFPPDPDLEPIHQRDYAVRAWKIDDSALLIRGAVMDRKPGTQIAARIEAAGGQDDGRPITVHHMVIDLTVSFPELAITGAEVVFEVHPQPGCPLIAPTYADLVGLPIARGFTHKVRELFGGPRGCTHTTALLQAMAPVALQCVFSMRNTRPGQVDRDGPREGAPSESAFMRDTCHVWSSEGELWPGVAAGRLPPMPLPMRERMRRAGLDPDELDPRAG